MPTNRRRDLERGRKCQMKTLPPEPSPLVPIPVEFSAVIGVYFSDRSGNGLNYSSRDGNRLIDSRSPQGKRVLKDRILAVARGCERACPAPYNPALPLRLSAPANGSILDFIPHDSTSLHQDR